MPIETKVPSKVPATLEAWVKLLEMCACRCRREPRPVVKAIRDSRRSLRDIAELMQDSPALVLCVMREANHPPTPAWPNPPKAWKWPSTAWAWNAPKLLARLPPCPATKSRRCCASSS
jgi:hypothetical protein